MYVLHMEGGFESWGNIKWGTHWSTIHYGQFFLGHSFPPPPPSCICLVFTYINMGGMKGWGVGITPSYS